MNLSCPEKTIESEQIAETPFLGGSFLVSNLERTPDGILTTSQYVDLLNRAMKAGNLTKGEAFSFAMFTSRLHSEYCHALQRYVFYLHKFVKTGEKTYKQKAQEFNQYVQDMLTVLDYSERVQQQGAEENLVTPTESMRPLSYQALRLPDSGNSKYTQQRVELQEQMVDFTSPEAITKLEKDMVSYSREKNKAATNLLATYAFLNLTAIGLLLYIFRAK